MNYQTKLIGLLVAWLLTTLATGSVFTQNIWQSTNEAAFAQKGMDRLIVPQHYLTFQLDMTALQAVLVDAPLRYSEDAESRSVLLELPMPDGQMAMFKVYDAPIMEPRLADKYPTIHSFAGVGVDDPTASVRFDVTPLGFHAMIVSARHSSVFIDPYAKGDTEHYISYYKKDFIAENKDFECLVEGNRRDDGIGRMDNTARNLLQGDCRLRTYRLALTCTGEYASFHGGTVELVLAAMNTTMTRVNGVFERDVNATMVIVEGNEDLIFLDSTTDPYNDGSPGQMIGECHTQCVNIIGAANFDIGHIFSTQGGGLAGLGVVCNENRKGNGVTGINNPVGDPFDIDYVAHEIGHQFGANHTQNNSCQRNGGTAMEPGSASTIMGYAGICSPNVQTNSDDYFHAISIQEMANYINNSTGNSCAAITETGNNAPTVNDVANYVLPISTPFRLTAEGADEDDDPITYCWEQMDNEVATMPPISTNTGGPAFRSFDPTESPTRYFPRLSDLVDGTDYAWEELPSVARDMSFRVTVRDNHQGSGCTVEDDVELEFVDTAGPFLVESPNTNLTWTAGLTENVSWDVANTDAAPISCAEVDILLSLDGGLTYPVVLASGVPNTGSFNVGVPEGLESTTARVMVVCASNIFFDISNEDFTIALPTAPTFGFSASENNFEVCGDVESVSTELSMTSLLSFAETVTLTLDGAPENAMVAFAENELVPSATTSLTIGNLTAVANGTYPMTITATSASVTMTQEISLTVTNGAPAMLVLTTPLNNATEQPTTLMLSWEAAASATNYQLEVATSPAFGASTFLSTNVTDNSFELSGLSSGAVYYWRVKSENICGESAFGDWFAFQTLRSDCTTYNSEDVPVVIPDVSTATVNSLLAVNDNFELLKVVVSMEVDHTWVGDLTAVLRSPSGTSVTLFDRPGRVDEGFGCAEDNLLVVFDDDAENDAAAFEDTCEEGEYAIEGTFQSIDPLAAFAGENIQGDWNMEISDAFDEDGGAILAWSLQLCGAPLEAEVLGLINTLWTVAPSTVVSVPNSNLLATSNLNTADNISFTLLSLPAEGNLSFNGMPALIGTTFTQADIDVGNLVYANTNPAATEDQFNFSVLSATGEWIPNETFEIQFGMVSLTASAVQTADLDCSDSTNGSITVNASGGTAPFMYSLNDGTPQAGNIFNDLGPGEYNITVSDSDGTTFTTNTITIVAPAAIEASASVLFNTITVTANGGVGELTYSIDGNEFQEENTFADLDNGIYTLDVMDANGCVVSTDPLVVNVITAVGFATSDVSCAGGQDGVLMINGVNGGLTPYTFRLNGTGDFVMDTEFTGLPAGSYTLEVMDAAGFIFTTSSFIIDDGPAISAAGTANENTITVTASGGTGGFTYSIDGVTFQSSNVFTGLDNGVYVILVMDENGCIASTEEITVNLVSVNELTFDLAFGLFPNPVQDQMTVTVNAVTGPSLRLQIFDVTGRLVQMIETEKHTNQLELVFDVKRLPAGSYQILLSDGQLYGKARFVKL